MPRQRKIEKGAGVGKGIGSAKLKITDELEHYPVPEQRRAIVKELEHNETYLELALERKMEVNDVVPELRRDAEVHAVNKPFSNQFTKKILMPGDKLKVSPKAPTRIKKDWDGKQGWELLDSYYRTLVKLKITYQVPKKRPRATMKNLLDKSNLLLKHWRRKL